MISILLEVILPVYLIAVTGIILGKYKSIDIKSISASVFYLFSPALIFRSLSESTMSNDIAIKVIIATWSIFFIGLVWARVWSIIRKKSHDDETKASFSLSVTTINAGNMGLPIGYLGFGDIGLEVAIIFLVANTTLYSTVNVFIASRANKMSKASMFEFLKYPMVYASILGVIFNFSNLEMPQTMMKSINFLGDAAIPTMLLVLGLQIYKGVEAKSIKDACAAIGFRLCIAPILMFFITYIIGLPDIYSNVLIVSAGLPTAVFTIILATEFNAKPELATTIVVGSTTLSFFTLTLLLWLVKNNILL
ncbi:MAG: AEC family transporter [Dehalococcoidia bacterium]|nr:AEC family transporter [Dehalococcoidia bacterium]